MAATAAHMTALAQPHSLSMTTCIAHTSLYMTSFVFHDHMHSPHAARSCQQQFTVHRVHRQSTEDRPRTCMASMLQPMLVAASRTLPYIGSTGSLEREVPTGLVSLPWPSKAPKENSSSSDLGMQVVGAGFWYVHLRVCECTVAPVFAHMP